MHPKCRHCNKWYKKGKYGDTRYGSYCQICPYAEGALDDWTIDNWKDNNQKTLENSESYEGENDVSGRSMVS